MSTSTCYLTINRFAKILIPSQEELYPAPKPSYKKNIVEHAFAYFGSLPGAWDFFRCADYLAQIFRSLPRMSAQSMQIAERVSGVLNRAGVAISLPKTCIDMINFKNSIKHLKHLRSLSLSSAQSIDDRRKSSFGLGFSWKGSTIFLKKNCAILSNVKVVNKGNPREKTMPVV